MESYQQAVLGHLEKLVSFYPASSEQVHVRSLLEYCQATLQATGSFQDAEIAVNDGIHSLVASTQGTKHPKILLQGHIDVVPAPLAMRQVLIDGDTLSGRGVYDMLFAAACYLALMEELRGQLEQLDVGIMLTGDEELGGSHGVNALVNAGYRPELCILPDAGRGFGDLNVAAKGVYGIDIVAQGIAHHSSRPWEGDGAGNKLVELLHELLSNFDASDHDNATATVTTLSGGDAINKGPREAKAHVDIRYPDKQSLRDIQSLVKRLCESYGAVIEGLDEADDYQLDTTNQLVQDFIACYAEHTGRPVSFSKAHGSSDARFFVAAGVPVIMLRPDGKGAHADHEELSLASLGKFYLLLKDFVSKTAIIKV